MAYKMIVSDLDGTFLNDDSQIPNSNLDALGLLAEKQIRFVLSSGRSQSSLDYFINCIGQKKHGHYAISFNGCLVYEADTFFPLRKKLLCCNLMKDIITHVATFSKVQVIVYDADGKLLTERVSPFLLDYVQRAGISYHKIDNFLSLNKPVSKVLLKGQYEDLEEVYSYMKDKTLGRYNMFYSGRNLLEFTDLEANKGSALLFLAQYLHINPKEVIAIGDNFNDIPMLQAAGLGIAMKNGETPVKQHADYISTAENNQGVLMEIISQFL